MSRSTRHQCQYHIVLGTCHDCLLILNLLISNVLISNVLNAKLLILNPLMCTEVLVCSESIDEDKFAGG